MVVYSSRARSCVKIVERKAEEEEKCRGHSYPMPSSSPLLSSPHLSSLKPVSGIQCCMGKASENRQVSRQIYWSTGINIVACRHLFACGCMCLSLSACVSVFVVVCRQVRTGVFFHGVFFHFFKEKQCLGNATSSLIELKHTDTCSLTQSNNEGLPLYSKQTDSVTKSFQKISQINSALPQLHCCSGVLVVCCFYLPCIYSKCVFARSKIKGEGLKYKKMNGPLWGNKRQGREN